MTTKTTKRTIQQNNHENSDFYHNQDYNENHLKHVNNNNHDNKISLTLFNHILLVIGFAGAAKSTIVLVIFAAN